MRNLRLLGPALLLTACGQDGEPTTADALAPESQEQLQLQLQLESSKPQPLVLQEADWPYHFVDATESSGLGGFLQVSGEPSKPFITDSIGGGVALFDCDGDGDLDAYLSNGARFANSPAAGGEPPRDALYLNDGKGHFQDGTLAAGLGDTSWTGGVLIGDYDGDGLRDIYLTNYGANVLYRNLGGGRFEDVSARAGVGDPGWSTGACYIDFDRDGDLDLYVSNYMEFDEARMLSERPSIKYKGVDVFKGPRGLEGARDSFYINLGDGSFREAGRELGIVDLKLFGFQVVAFDADEDGWVDLYVANDSVKNVLWHNDQGRGFVDSAFFSGVALSQGGKPQAGMGVALGDYDGDLRTDIFVTNFADDYFTLYRGNRKGSFVDTSYRMKLVASTKAALGWGCGFADFDGDGDQELYMATGHVYPQIDDFEVNNAYRQRNILLELHDGVFREPPGAGGPGFALETTGRGSALGDVDGDGDLDILFGNLDAAPTLLLNQAKPANRIQVSVLGAGANTEAVGARVLMEAAGKQQLALVATGGSFLSSSTPLIHFGLGAATQAGSITVIWPDGHQDQVQDVPAGSTVRFAEGAGEAGAARIEVSRSVVD